MKIANPIYDSVFKYLMDDNRVARLIIGTIIEADVKKLDFVPRERSTKIHSLGLTVFRLDFSAVIKTAEGETKNVIIELQKADGGDDLRRFRRYLAENYYSLSPAKNTGPKERRKSRAKESLSGSEKPVLPIISVYILGEKLPELAGHSAVMVRRRYLDAVTGKEIRKRDPFIESLTHDSYVIQLSELKERRRNRLEKMLALFEQIGLTKKPHFKEFNEKLPAEFGPILDRLARAALEREILDLMILEDDFLEQWKEKERSLEQKLDGAISQKEEERRQKEEAHRLLEEERKQKEEFYQRAVEALIKTGISREAAEKALLSKGKP